MVRYVLQKAAGNAVTLHPLGAITQNIEGKALAEMLDMRAGGAIAFTDGWKPVQNTGLMLKALEYVKSFSGILLQIPQDNALAEGGLMHEGYTSARLGMAGIPPLAETLMVHRDLSLLRYTGSRLHLTGLSAAGSVELIRDAKKEGLQVSCSVTPYHLALTDEMLSGYSSLYKVTPPLRSEADRQALIAGLGDGTIDCIASHHRPQDWDAKTKEFEYAAPGMNVQEMAFSIVWNAVQGIVSIERVIDALSTRPRHIFGIADNRLAINEKASFTLFTLGEHSGKPNTNLKSLSANNPFAGTKLKGKVIGIANNNTFVLNTSTL